MDTNNQPPQNNQQGNEQNTEQDYQGTGTAAEGHALYHAEIDPALQALALENLRTACKGNGIKPQDIEVTKFEGETLEFLAVTLLKLKTKIGERTQAGKVTGPTLLANAQMIKDAITKEEHKITHSQDVIKRIKEIILQRPDKGFALENEFIKLPFLHKQFAVYEACTTCRSQGKMPCTHCSGKGKQTCPQCRGQGSEVCNPCGGRQFLAGPNGQKQHCMHCNATGRKNCTICNQSRQIACNACKGASIITCNQCNGHAWNSRVFTAEIDVFANYEYDEAKLPEKIIRHIKTLGPHLPEHAELKPVNMIEEQEQNTIAIPYQIRLPHADMVFKIKNMELGAFMFGTQALLFDMPYFLERIMAPGIKHLKAAGTNQGDIAQNLQKSGRYKTLRQIILAASKLSPERASIAIAAKTPIGLSEDIRKKLIILADRAMRQITHRPRQIGTATGIALAGGLYAGYFHVLRAIIIQEIPPLPMVYNLIDFIALGLGITSSIFAIKWSVGRALHKTLASLMKGTNQKMKLAKAGRQAYWAGTGALIIYCVVAASTISTQAPIPHWITQLHNLI